MFQSFHVVSFGSIVVASFLETLGTEFALLTAGFPSVRIFSVVFRCDPTASRITGTQGAQELKDGRTGKFEARFSDSSWCFHFVEQRSSYGRRPLA